MVPDLSPRKVKLVTNCDGLLTEKERAKAEHEKKLNAAYDKAMKAIDEYLELAGITVEETKNGYKVIQRMTDEDADDIWDSILNALMN